MTVSLERPAVPVDEMPDLVEPYDEPHAVVTLQVRVSRDQLAAAVEMSASHGWGITDPDTLTVEQTRYFAVHNLVCMSALELEQGARAMAFLAGPDADDVSQQDYVRGIYRAVDRAFPKTG
ncbi:hypothetical protein [Streptomyces sp. SID8499]|uniref:hypothetical protein n=1 Tax=Streptomyces sp. SID8499 TaxID=2706106 RepID=UPI0013C81303|nr:hypothetical protein [Streptomyces sp. SID8499]NED31974.1 hypothetical protein [Streptomyces sp. SID8499]